MKSTNLIASATILACLSAVPIPGAPYTNSSSKPQNSHAITKHITIHPFSSLQIEALLANCKDVLSKVNNETRSLFGIDAEHDELQTCERIIAKMYPERGSNSSQSHVSKRSLDLKDNENGTSDYGDEEFRENDHKEREKLAEAKLKTGLLDCYIEFSKKGTKIAWYKEKEFDKCVEDLAEAYAKALISMRSDLDLPTPRKSGSNI